MRTVSSPLEEYFNWLYSQIDPVTLSNPSRTHWLLCEQMFNTPFEWLIANDDNRLEDGLELRIEFGLDLQKFAYIPCSVLEVLVALARRLAFETGEEDAEWFWRMIANLGLGHMSDEEFPEGGEAVTAMALQRFIERRYDRDGHGGLFPLRESNIDQRKVEIWYQMSAYLLESEGDMFAS